MSLRDLSDWSDDDLVHLFQDKDERLSRRIKSILMSDREIGTQPAGINKEQLADVIEPLQSGADLAAPTGLRGLYFAVLRRGAGHNDPNWGRMSTNIGGRNYGYTHRQPVGDLFRFGDNPAGVEIWCPWYASTTGVTYHTYVELWADPVYWRPGGVLGWVEAWGKLTFEKERKIAGYDWNLRINP
jgi:hypothetical protein